MYLEELQEALVGDRATIVEHGFATIVAWPAYDDLIGSTPDLRQVALVASCEALFDDLRPLPAEVAERLAVVTGVPSAQTYVADAYLVLATWPAFAKIVAR